MKLGGDRKRYKCGRGYTYHTYKRTERIVLNLKMLFPIPTIPVCVIGSIKLSITFCKPNQDWTEVGQQLLRRVCRARTSTT